MHCKICLDLSIGFGEKYFKLKQYFFGGIVSYNIYLSCLFQVKLIFKRAKFHKRNEMFKHACVYFMILKNLDITDISKKKRQKIVHIRSISFVLTM